jgi:hypothetical protein
LLKSTYKDSEEDVRIFDSVSACSIAFAHEARRQYAAQGLRGDDLFDAVVNDVALLFADYDSTTGEDPEEVHGGDDNVRYHYELHSCADVKTAMADARTEDEAERKRQKEKK